MISIGVNYSGYHDSAAALAIDGKIVYAIAEERLTRIKQDASFPVQAIKACIRFAGISPSDVDHYVLSWPPSQQYYLHNLKEALTGAVDRSAAVELLNYLRSLTTRKVNRLFEQHGFCKADVVQHMNHHLAHAWSVAPYLKQDRSLIFILDGRGSRESTSVYLKQNHTLQLLERVNHPNSLGNYYAEVTAFCGFKKFSDEWKVMGLAPYGKNLYPLDHLLSFSEGRYEVNYKLMEDASVIRSGGKTFHRCLNDKNSISDQEIKDFALSAQHHYEQFLKSYVGYYMKKYDVSSIGIAGGVGLNCKANGYILRELKPDEFFIQPAATDDGTAIGAALFPFHASDNAFKQDFNPYLGNEYSDNEIKEILTKYKIRYEYLSNCEADAAQSLSEGKIIGWFQGRDEYGPRALGNRSILSDPRTAIMKEKVNEIVKYRENWRPFAPSILDEYAEEILQHVKSSPYMILTDIVKREYADRIPAVVHVDQTLRPQTVSKKWNQKYWQLIQAFYQITGVPVVMNTSFNLKGEPNVSSPSDALRTFFTSGLDILYLGNFKIIKQAL